MCYSVSSTAFQKTKIMIYLIVDTSTDICLIALVKENQILASHSLPHHNLLSKNLLPTIRELLEKSSISLSSLSFIATGVGPGSYTGTRLGAAVAKGLGFGLNISIKPFYSPLAFLPPQDGSFLFVIPTRAGPYFILKGRQSCKDIIVEDTALITAERLETAATQADYLIASLSQALPESLSHIPLFPPSLNLNLLTQYLSSAPSLPPEEIALQYLHTPI